MKKKISVNIHRLELFWGIDLHEFKPGETYPLSTLLKAIGLPHATPKSKSRGDTK